MHTSDSRSAQEGFTLVEALVILAILGIALGLGLPALSRLITRSELEAAGRETAVLVQRARLEAIKRRVRTVVELDPATGDALAYADVDGEAAGDAPDLELNPVAGELRFDTDYRLGAVTAPSAVRVAAPGGQPAVDGLTVAPDGRRVLVFFPTGAADRAGGFRLADASGWNHLEVRIEPAGTGRIELRKWNRDLARWQGRGEGGEPWEWYAKP
ncbi:MAG: prepilin-type N-terminal cleavage/methylation domain-containing protein [Acidobacteriota bacterium]|jgi:type II secretory pathway pseudopilin PulG